MSENPYSNVGYVILGWEISDIEGKILTIVEGMGVSQKQEDAVKGLLRQAIWGVINSPHRMHVYDDSDFQKVKEMQEKKEKSWKENQEIKNINQVEQIINN